jgi:hypothetical protein
MLALTLRKVALKQLCLHRRLQLLVPAAFHLDNDPNAVGWAAARVGAHGVNVDIRQLSWRPLTPIPPSDFHLAPDDDSPRHQIIFKVPLDIIGQIFLFLRTSSHGVPQQPRSRCLALQLFLQASERFLQHVEKLATGCHESPITVLGHFDDLSRSR